MFPATSARALAIASRYSVRQVLPKASNASVTRKLFSSTARRVGVQQPTHTVVHSRFMVTSAGVMGLAVLMSQEAAACEGGAVEATPVQVTQTESAAAGAGAGAGASASASATNVKQSSTTTTTTTSVETSEETSTTNAASGFPLGGDLGRKISLGMITGFATGYAVKKVGKVVLLGAGIIFVSVQILSYLGYVETVRWDKVEKDLVSKLDTDGSGELTTKDFWVHWNRFLALCRHNVPGRLAFSAAALMGLRYG